MIHEQLDKGKVTGLGYCSDVLKLKNTREAESYRPLNILKCGGHASIVVGRRYRYGKCQIKVRNTWGKDCRKYPHWDCENGEVWIDQNQLGKATTSINIVE